MPENQNSFNSEEVELDLRRLWTVLVRRRWWVIGFTLSILGLALLTTLLSRPVYRASALLLIQTSGGLPLEALGLPKEVTSLIPTAMNQDLAAHIQLIKSRTTLERLRTNLLSDPVFLAILSKERSGFAFANPHSTDPESLLPLARLQNSIQARSISGTRLIQVEVEDTNPEKAALIANALAGVYQEIDRERARSALQSLAVFLDEKIKETQQELQVTEEKLAHLAQELGIVLDVNALVAGVSRLEQLRAEALVNLHDTEKQLEAVNKFLAEVKQDLFEKFGGPEGAALLKELYDKLALIRNIQREISDMEARRAAALEAGNYILAMDLQNKIVEKRKQMEEEAVQKFSMLEKLPQYEQLISQQYELTLKLEALRNRVSVLEQLKAEETRRLVEAVLDLSRLQRDVKISENLYTLLVTQFARARIAEMGEVGTVVIADPATPPEAPVRPRKAMNLAIGLFLGLVCGVGAAFVAEALDTRFRSRADVQATLGMPILGVVPNLPEAKRKSVILLTEVDHDLRDVYASVILNLRMAHPDRSSRSILITGAEKGIGKSTTAINLALVWASQKKRVVVVEADLRRPSLGKVLSFGESRFGLTEWVVGEAGLDQVTQEIRSEGYPPVHLIPAGCKPPSPVDFFDSQAFKNALAELTEKYDLVIIDAPPILLAPETILLATLVEGVLCLVDAEVSDKRQVLAGLEQLRGVKAPLLGVLINRAPAEYFGYYRSYYHYYEPEKSKQRKENKRDISTKKKSREDMD